MNKEEAIDILKNSIADYVIGEYCEKCADNKICNDRNEDCYFQQAIDIVVTAYEKEKEANRKLDKEAQGYLEELVGDDSMNIRRIQELEAELEKEKEKNKELESDIQQKNFEVKCLNSDIKSMYCEEGVIAILEDNFGLSREEAIQILEEE